MPRTPRLAWPHVSAATSIDRLSVDDLMSLAADVGPAPLQIGAVLMLAGGAHLGPKEIMATIEERIRAVPRLRRRLVRPPLGCGRPLWVDHAGFDLAEHVAFRECPGPGDAAALFTIAADVLSTRLPLELPMWRLTVVTGLHDAHTAIIVAMHHALADGIGGLAVLAALLDGSPPTVAPAFPQSAPTIRTLAYDAARSRMLGVARLPAQWRRITNAVGTIRPSSPPTSRSSINHPTGATRRLTTISVDLGDVLRAARRNGATVNDVVLTAIASSLRRLSNSRGEQLDRVVASIPVSARLRAGPEELGNDVGVALVDLPAVGDRLGRLWAITAATRQAKEQPRGASTAVLGPVFRLLARLGLLRWYINRQRFVNTFVTNLHGPDSPVSFLGVPVADITAIAIAPGNVAVSFAVLSYAGTLTVTVIADPAACPDLEVVTGFLHSELDALIAAGPRPAERAGSRS